MIVRMFLLGVHAALHGFSGNRAFGLGCSHPVVQAFILEVYSLHVFERASNQSDISYYNRKSNTF